MQYVTVQIVLPERKTSLIIVSQRRFGTLESEKGKMFGSNFQERFNWEKAAKNKSKNQNNAFCFSFISFFTWSSQHQILKANTYSILTNGNLDYQCQSPQLYNLKVKSWNNPGDSSFLLNGASSLKIHIQHPE